MADGLISQQNKQQEGQVEGFNPEQPEGRESSKYDSAISQIKREQESAFQRTFSTALEKNPDQAVQVDRLSRRTGLPRAAVESDIGRATQVNRAKEIQGMVQRSPILARQMQDADFASISHDDVEQLSRLEGLFTLQPQEEQGEEVGFFEGTAQSFQSGARTLTLAELNNKIVAGTATPEEVQKRDELSEQMVTQTMGEPDNWFETLAFATAEQIPIVGSIGLEFAEGMGTGGLAVGGPLLAIPGVGAPAAATAGLQAGSALGTTYAVRKNFEIQRGLAYEEYRYFVDEQGNPLDDQTAKFSSAIAAVLNTGLDTAGLRELAKGIPGLRNLSEISGRKFVKNLLQRPTYRQAIQRLASTYARGVTFETATEVAQELVTSLVGESTKLISDQEFESATPGEVFERLTGASVEAFQATILLAAPGPVSSFAIDARRAQQAEKNVRTIQALNESAGDSKTRERVPERFRRFVEEATADGPVENMYVDVDKWDELFQSENIDPQEAAAEVFGDNGAAYREARAEGGDLQIPTARYAEKIAGTDFADRLAPDVRFGVDQMSAREAQEFQAEMEQMAQDVETEQPAAFTQIRDDIAGQLINSGVPQDAAENSARLSAAFITTQARYENIDPLELYQSRSQRINRPMPEVLATRGGQIDTSLDPMIDRVRVGDIPSERDVFGEGLTDFLREYGLVPDSELDARDVDQRLAPFQRRMVRDDGQLTLDDAALYAWEEGFIQSELGPDQRPTPDDLLRAIDAELSGQPVFRQRKMDTPQATERQMLQELDQFFAEMGVDLNEISNEEARQMLEDAAAREADVQLDQPFDGPETPQTQLGNQVTVEIDGVEKPALNSEGRPIHFSEEGVRNFWRWFGDSQVVDEQGRPIVVYHGTASSFDQFSAERLGEATRAESAGQAFFFTDNPEVSSAYAQYAATDAQVGALIDQYNKAIDEENFDLADNLITQAEQLESEFIGDGRLRGQNIMPSYIRTESPFELDAGGEVFSALDQSINEILFRSKEMGGDGVIIRNLDDAPDRINLESDHFAVFDENSIKSAVGNLGTFREGENILRQDRRGSIRFQRESDRRVFNISLFDKANLSTYLHESGHYFLELLGDLVEREGASERLRADYQRILEFLEVDSREQIGTPQHEKWARAFEAYLREGNAPSVELETAFAKFRAWLVAIYRQLRSLNVELTDEVRGVMDRMLATDEQIQAAQESQNYQPIFDSAEQANMSTEEFAEYQRTVEMARAEAENDLLQRMMREMERESKQWWKDRREEVRAEVEQDVYSQAPFRAMFFLQKGRMPFGEQPIDAFKLDRNVLVERYGKEFLKRLPGPKSQSNRGAYVYTRENGVHPDTAATMLGFGSADEMIKSMINARDARELIDADTDVRMRQQYGDMLTDGSLPEAAMQAVHNNARAKLLARELQILNRRRGNRGRGPIEQIKASAQRAINQKRIVDIRPDVYRRAEAKAARASFQAALDQNFDLAFTEKQRQIYNHYLFREARNAREQADKDRRRILQFNKKRQREILGKAGDDYLQQVDQILADHQFSNISNRAIERRIELREWLASKADEFTPVQEPEYVAADESEKAANQAALDADPRNPNLESLASEAARIAWKEMTPEELSGVRQNIDLVYHLAKLKTELIEQGEKRTLDQAAEEVVSSINENANRRVVADLQPERATSKARRGRDEFFTKSRRVPSFAREMDGGEDAGAVWRNVIQPINRASNNYNDRIQQHGKRFERLFDDHYSKSEQANFLKNPVYYESIDASLTKDAVLALALNWGNETNRKRLMDGEGWSQSQIESVLGTLEKRDWDFVQSAWDYLEEYWPEFRENHRALYGIPPEKVASAPVSTRFGEYRGGYYPIKFDSTRSTRANVQQIQEQGRRFQDPANRARAGASQSRVRGQVRMPLRLSVASVMNQHVNEVIKHVEFDRPLLDVGRLVTRNDVRDAMVSNYGQAVYNRFYRMLVDVRWGVRPAENVFESFLDHTRNGASVAFMGFKATTSLLQPLGISNSLVILGGNEGAGKGAYWALRGLARVGRSAVSMENAAKFAMTNSSFMRARRQNINREVSNVLAQVKGGSLRQKIAASAFWPIVNMQFAIVDLPTWYGGYEKSIAAGLEEKTAIEVADQTVRDAQGGGDLIDQTEFQRGNAYTRSFTNFMSYMATTYSIQAERYRSYNLRSFSDYVRLITDHMLLAVFPAVGNLLIQSMRDSEDDEEDLGAKMAFEYANMATGAFIGVRELTGALEGFSYRGPAGQSGLSEMSRLFTQTGQVAFSGDIDESIEQLDKSLARSALRTTGVIFHLPAAQVDATFFGTKALIDGETDNPMSVIFGPPRK